MKKVILTLCCCFLGLGATTLFAQRGNIAAGGNASGTGGSVSFSIGQIFYSSPSAVTHSIVQGLQQPYEISIVSGLDEKATGINLTASVFPVPAIDQFTLKVESGNLKNYVYELYDAQGKLLYNGKVIADETSIEVVQLSPAHYYLKVSEGDQIIKTFKIIKSY